MTTLSNKRVVREFEDLADGGGDLDRLDTLCDANIVNHALAADRPRGIDGTRQFLEQARRTTHPARWLSSHMVAENDLVVHFGAREHEWPGGSFRGLDLAPGRYTRDVMFAYRLLDGRIVERWAIRDDLAMIAQLGNLASKTSAQARQACCVSMSATGRLTPSPRRLRTEPAVAAWRALLQPCR